MVFNSSSVRFLPHILHWPAYSTDQYGFCPTYSTDQPLHNICQVSIMLLIKSFQSIYSGFGLLSHSILLDKLRIYGIRAIAHTWFVTWFVSCLHNRKQYTSFKKVSSSHTTIKCGVPQGSILGPVLFFFLLTSPVVTIRIFLCR